MGQSELGGAGEVLLERCGCTFRVSTGWSSIRGRAGDSWPRSRHCLCDLRLGLWDVPPDGDRGNLQLGHSGTVFSPYSEEYHLSGVMPEEPWCRMGRETELWLSSCCFSPFFPSSLPVEISSVKAFYGPVHQPAIKAPSCGRLSE